MKLALKQWRRAKGLSEEETAKRLGVHRATLVRWEKGNRMPVGKAVEYCDILGISINDVEFNV